MINASPRIVKKRAGRIQFPGEHVKNLVKYLIVLSLLVGVGAFFVVRVADAPREPMKILEYFSPKASALQASGIVEEVLRSTGDFSRLELSGSGSVVVALGKENSVLVKTDRAFLDSIETEARDGTLRLGVKNGVRLNGPRVTYEVTAKSLSAIKTSGDGDVRIVAPLTAAETEFRTEGSGSIDALVDSKKATIRIAGSGDVRLTGKAEEVTIQILGSGGVAAAALSGGKATADVKGSGSVELGTFSELEANIAGSGDVVYAGAPRLTSRVIGSGKLRSR